MQTTSEEATKIEGLGLILAAGGSSSRFGEGNKLLAELGGMPLFIWPLRELSQVVCDGMIALAAPKEELSKFEEALKWHLPERKIALVEGGPTRVQSVLNALKALPEAAEIAAVHDAARPFIRIDTLKACVEACRSYGGSVAAKRVTNTVKEASPDGIALRTLDRSCLWSMETPQVFKRRALIEACEKAVAAGASPTDDAAAMELLGGVKTKLVENPHFNMKITYASDFDVAKMLLSKIHSL